MLSNPSHFRGTDEDGIVHEFVVLRNVPLEALEAMLNAQTQIDCDCDDGHIHEHTTSLVRGSNGRIQGILISRECHGECPNCAGRGWVYGMLPS